MTVDIADIIVFAIKEKWPNVDCTKELIDQSWNDAWGIWINNINLGVSFDGRFLIWNEQSKGIEDIKPADPKFLDFVLHWAQVKGCLMPPV